MVNMDKAYACVCGYFASYPICTKCGTPTPGETMTTADDKGLVKPTRWPWLDLRDNPMILKADKFYLACEADKYIAAIESRHAEELARRGSRIDWLDELSGSRALVIVKKDAEIERLREAMSDLIGNIEVWYGLPLPSRIVADVDEARAILSHSNEVKP